MPRNGGHITRTLLAGINEAMSADGDGVSIYVGFRMKRQGKMGVGNEVQRLPSFTILVFRTLRRVTSVICIEPLKVALTMNPLADAVEVL